MGKERTQCGADEDIRRIVQAEHDARGRNEDRERRHDPDHDRNVSRKQDRAGNCMHGVAAGEAIAIERCRRTNNAIVGDIRAFANQAMLEYLVDTDADGSRYEYLQDESRTGRLEQRCARHTDNRVGRPVAEARHPPEQAAYSDLLTERIDAQADTQFELVEVVDHGKPLHAQDLRVMVDCVCDRPMTVP